tara:strand:- start:2470 stop:3051 length:582 start_codon:yes stop_codon:yes gene_type:complete
MMAQSVFSQTLFSERFVPSSYHFSTMKLEPTKTINNYPEPKTVLRQSLLIPGWGQVTNRQAWKVPIIYGLLGGLGYYSVYLTKEYHNYRAAYYNSFSTNTDLRFGTTPDYLIGSSATYLKSNRDFLRNRRDFIYITIALSHLLNVVDAYVFAHLRTFDVSDDLSMNGSLSPTTISTRLYGEVPAVTLSINLNR